jgi:hypothetical protein
MVIMSAPYDNREKPVLDILFGCLTGLGIMGSDIRWSDLFAS